MKKILEIYNLASSAQQFIGDRFDYFQQSGDYQMNLIATPNETIFNFAEKHRISYHPTIIKRHFSFFYDFKALLDIYKYLKANEIDILVTSNAKASVLGQIAGFFAGTPYRIVVAHGSLFETQNGIMRRLVVSQFRMASSISHRVICVSESVRRRRAEEKIDDPIKQVVIGNGTASGVDSENQFNPNNYSREEIANLRLQLGLSSNDFVIGFCGRLVKDKGIVELVGAFNILKHNNQGKSLKLLILGRRESWDSIPDHVADSLVSSSDIIFSGYIPHDEIHKYYLQMNVFVLPSYREGFPTVVLEASSLGIPVIVSKATGCVDSIIENVTGLYTDITPQSISTTIERFFDEGYANCIGENGREWVVNNFEHKIVVKNWYDFFRSIG